MSNPSVATQSLALLPSSLFSLTGPNNMDKVKLGLLQLSAHQYINSWNKEQAADQGFSLAPNRFSSLSHEQFLATSLGHTPTPKPSVHTTPGYLGQYKKKFDRKHLPKHVDWRGTGADMGVKDQVGLNEPKALTLKP